LASARRGRTTLVAADHGRSVLGLDVADDQELMSQLAIGVQQREVLLIGLHGQDQAFLGHGQEFLLEFADQHIGALDQGRHLVQQGRVVDGAHVAANAFGSRLQLAGDIGTALGKAGDHGALFTQLLGIAVGVLDDHGVHSGFKAVTMRGGAGGQAQGLHADQHLGAMHHDQAVGRAHKVHAGPAVLQLVAHDLGMGSLARASSSAFCTPSVSSTPLAVDS
jgi:hypothetical protein